VVVGEQVVVVGEQEVVVSEQVVVGGCWWWVLLLLYKVHYTLHTTYSYAPGTSAASAPAALYTAHHILLCTWYECGISASYITHCTPHTPMHLVRVRHQRQLHYTLHTTYSYAPGTSAASAPAALYTAHHILYAPGTSAASAPSSP
jgi:hypothetical protein